MSLHADTIASRHDGPEAASPAGREGVAAVLEEQHVPRAELAASLRPDPLAGDASDEAVEAARPFVAAVDELSTLPCRGVDRPREVSHVLTRSGLTTTLAVTPAGGAVAVATWPSTAPRLTAPADGKAPTVPSPSDEAPWQGLREVPAVTAAAVRPGMTSGTGRRWDQAEAWPT